MNDTYEINESNQVVPYTSGRKCTDTRAWRDATDLELQQQEQIEQLQRELAEARERCCQAINDYETAVLREHRMQEQRDTLVEVLKLCEKHLEKHGHEKCDEELDETGWWLLCDVRTALAAVKGGNDE